MEISVRDIDLCQKDAKKPFDFSGDVYAKFQILITRDMNFTEYPAAYPIEVESTVEWEVMIELLDEFYQSEYGRQLSNYDDDENMPYPTWYDGKYHHESKTIEEWIRNGNKSDLREFGSQFVEANKVMMLNDTQFDQKSELRIIKRENKKRA